MNSESNFNNKIANPRILICPLDWGLGHATRCIPIINELIDEGCIITIAADKNCLKLLKLEFPGVDFLILPGYEISYAKKGVNLKWKMFFQLPRIVNKIIKENRWLRNQLSLQNFDAVISDNRFGLFSNKVKCIYITHQLLIKTGNSFTDKIVQKLNYYFIKKYDECWIPDAEKDGLAGSLSHPRILPANCKYLGPLSRFQKIQNEIIYDNIFILSGPEPQRTLLENIITSQSSYITGNNLLIRGTENTNMLPVSNNFLVMNIVPSEQLNTLISGSKNVISRAGYSTVMDLARLKKKALLIPTPGQTEQEYLAGYLMSRKIFFTALQTPSLNLSDQLNELDKCKTHIPDYNWHQFKYVIKNFILSLQNSTFASPK